MKNKKTPLLVIITCLILIPSCLKEEIVKTAFYTLIVNDSGRNYVVESKKHPDLNTVLTPSHLNVPNGLNNSNQVIYDEVLNEVVGKLTSGAFQEKIGILKVYYLSATNDTIYYEGSIDFVNKLSNWKYSYDEDYNVGYHYYDLRLE